MRVWSKMVEESCGKARALRVGRGRPFRKNISPPALLSICRVHPHCALFVLRAVRHIVYRCRYIIWFLIGCDRQLQTHWRGHDGAPNPLPQASPDGQPRIDGYPPRLWLRARCQRPRSPPPRPPLRSSSSEATSYLRTSSSKPLPHTPANSPPAPRSFSKHRSSLSRK